MKEWAKQMLLREIDDGFKNSLRLTWIQSRIPILAFLDFSADGQRHLAEVLPSGARFSNSHYESIRRALPRADQLLIEKLNENIARRMDSSVPGEVRDFALLAFSADRRKVARSLAKLLAAELKKVARQRGFKIEPVEPYVFWASITLNARIYVVQFDVLHPFVVSYGLKSDMDNIPTRLFVDYLGALGLGSSGWVCASEDQIGGVVVNVLDFCEWHIRELETYRKLRGG